MNKYIIHGQSFSGNVTLEYDYNDRLNLILFECEMNDKQHEQFVRAIPLSEADFLNRATRSGVIFSTVPVDLSFANRKGVWEGDVSTLPVMKAHCKTCPFKPNERGLW